ncbi:MAG TPA: hypothetical protein VGE69_13770, partial [Pseudomonadales bacterium]
SKKRISGSNGHVLYDHKFVDDIVHDNSEADFKGDLILRPESSVPPKARIAIIEIRESVAVISYYKNEIDAELQDPLKRDAASLIAGKFPNIDAVLAVTREDPVATPRIGLNQSYLALSEKIFKRLADDVSTPVLVMHGSDKAAHVELANPVSGQHYFLVMPMRIEDAAERAEA